MSSSLRTGSGPSPRSTRIIRLSWTWQERGTRWGMCLERVTHTSLEGTATGEDQFGCAVSGVKNHDTFFSFSITLTHTHTHTLTLTHTHTHAHSHTHTLMHTHTHTLTHSRTNTVNFLITECLERYYFYYGDELKVECPTGSGNKMNLLHVSQEICRRIVSAFVPDENGRRPCHGDDPRYTSDPHWNDLVLFYEYFNGDNGKGCGAR